MLSHCFDLTSANICSKFFFVIDIPAYSGMLDGKTFIGKNGEIGKSGSEDDEIKFENGKYGKPEQVKWWKGKTIW